MPMIHLHDPSHHGPLVPTTSPEYGERYIAEGDREIDLSHWAFSGLLLSDSLKLTKSQRINHHAVGARRN